jgi:hypothetical protein
MTLSVVPLDLRGKRLFLEYLDGRELPGVAALSDASATRHVAAGT